MRYTEMLGLTSLVEAVALGLEADTGETVINLDDEFF
jgi:hypothetical protein